MSASQKLVDQAARDAVANDLSTTFLLEAAAGTGKTTSLLSRILSIVRENRARLSEIVAITFTEKAAGELKIRLRQELERAKLRDALADLERAQIATIHSFCAWMLRERPVEAAIDPQFSVADDLQRGLLLDESWQTWLESELPKNPPALRHALLADFTFEKLKTLAVLLADEHGRLDSAQFPDKLPLHIDEIVERLRAAAPKLEQCLADSADPAANFSQSAREFLDALPRIERASDERKLTLIAALELKSPRAKKEFHTEETWRRAKETASELKNLLEAARETAGHNLLVELVGWLGGFVAHFERLKRERGVLDFGDLLLKTRDLLRDNPAVRGEFQNSIKFLLVDEFQDTDPLQVEIVFYLAEQKPTARQWQNVRLRAGKLFLVGDPKQSIYGFRRADIEVYSQARRVIETQGKVLALQQNFRSLSTILEWVNTVFAPLIRKPDDGDYQPDYIPLEPSEKFVTKSKTVTLLRPKQPLDDNKIGAAREAEASAIANFLKQNVESGEFSWKDAVILLRSFAALDTFTDTLVQFGVPFGVVGGKNFYVREEIQTLASLLSCLDNPADTLDLVAVLRSPLFGWADELIFLIADSVGLNYLRALDDANLREISEAERDLAQKSFAILRGLHESRHKFSVAGYIEHVFSRAKICEAYFLRPDGAQCVANLMKALELARQLEAAGLRSVRAFARRLRETVLGGVEEEPSPASEETDDVVRIMSVHKSKGLEFPVVILADLAGKFTDSAAKFVLNRTNGRIEIRAEGRRTADFDDANEHQKSREAAEEIRLLYVAATRAQQRLVIPQFAEKGGRLELLRSGLTANELLEVVEWDGAVPSAREIETRSDPSKFIEKRRKWQSEHKELLARAAKPLPIFAPSMLGDDAERVQSRDEDIEAGARAREIGARVHEILATLDIQKPRLEQKDFPDARVRELLQTVLDSSLFARVKSADEVLREVPFSVKRDGGMVEGYMDLLFREGEKWVLVDYKTDRVTKSDAENYARNYKSQLDAYAEALEKIAKIRVAEKIVYFLSADAMVTL
jgi:ATP-dependent helicase/nuclease subunit A